MWAKSEWEAALGSPIVPVSKDLPSSPELDDVPEAASDDEKGVEGEHTENTCHPCTCVATVDATLPVTYLVQRSEDEPSALVTLTPTVFSSLENTILSHPIPLQPTRTNVVTEDQVPRSRLFGAFCTRGA
eukprot:635041-Amphidinium_carterae.1